MGDGPWLAGADLTLADLYAAPMFDLFLLTPEGAEIVSRHQRLAGWWDAVSARPSLAATRGARPGLAPGDDARGPG